MQPGFRGTELEEGRKRTAEPLFLSEYSNQVLLVYNTGLGWAQGYVAIFVAEKTVFCPNVVAIGEESGTSATGKVGACQGICGAAVKGTVTMQEVTGKTWKNACGRQFSSIFFLGLGRPCMSK